MNERVTISELLAAKAQGLSIAEASCYDYTTAMLAAQTDVRMILIGDSAEQAMLGFDSSLPATTDSMVAITAAVRRGAPNVFLVAGMPFLSYQVGIAKAIKNAGRFMVQPDPEMVKIEAISTHLDVMRAVSDAGIAVMVHIGLRPQSVSKIGD